MKIKLKNGSEGPKHDPYSYTKYIAVKEAKVIEYHSGLAQYIKVTTDGKEETFNGDEKELDAVFKKLTGLTVARFVKCINRIEFPDKCPACGCRYMKWTDGYPGETMRVCARCSRVTGYIFDESQII